MRDGAIAVAEAIRSARRVAIFCHVNPDGDTIGSALALRLGLLSLGKEAAVFCADKVPDILSGLPGADGIRLLADFLTAPSFDLLFPVDIASADRLGRLNGLPAFEQLRALSPCPTAQVDHHGTNPGYCEANWIDGGAPAAGLLIYRLLQALSVPVTADIASCLYAAISTDTGNFSHGNTNAEAFRVTAELMETGFPLTQLNRRLFTLQPEAQLRLTARAVESLVRRCGGQISMLRLTAADFEACGALPEHADTVVNRGLALEGAKIAVLVRQQGEQAKVSLRAIAPVRVDEIARSLGGGGHAQAAGCTLSMGVDEACEALLPLLARALDSRG